MQSIVPVQLRYCLPLIFTVSLTMPIAHGQCTAQALSVAQQQLSKTLNYIDSSHFPEITVSNGQGTYSSWDAGDASGWSTGFFPAWIWYMYEQTLDNALLSRARAQTASLSSQAMSINDATDLGFKIMGSYGTGYSIVRDPSYIGVIQTAAQTKSNLYSSTAGVFNSQPNHNSSTINVIIDDMVNLELMFYAAQNGGNANWYSMALSHALKTAQNNVRPDGSTYQGVEYNSNGTVNSYYTVDGASANSTWSRGQAWAIYGFTMSYRYTHNATLLAAAQAVANYLLANLPPDYVPYWDFTQNNYRDSSAASIAASALLELSTYVAEPAKTTYRSEAMDIQNSLSSLYLGNPLNTDGILLHGTYSVPANYGVDKSVIWGDRYFIEGCFRATPPPPQVVGLSAGAVSSNQVPLSWQAQTGAVRYNVKRSATAGGPYTTIAPPPILTSNGYTDTTVALGTIYYYVVSASGVGGEGIDSAEVMVNTPAAAPDFSLSASAASVTVSQSSGTTSKITVDALNGFSATVSLKVTSSPAGPATILTPASITRSGASLLSINASGVPAGTYKLTITGTSGAIVHSTVVTLTVTEGGSFTLAANPASLAVSKSTSPSASSTVHVASAHGFAGTVKLTVSAPRGVTATISPSIVNASPGTPGAAVLKVTVGAGTKGGAQSVTVKGTISIFNTSISVPIQVSK